MAYQRPTKECVVREICFVPFIIFLSFFYFPLLSILPQGLTFFFTSSHTNDNLTVMSEGDSPQSSFTQQHIVLVFRLNEIPEEFALALVTWNKTCIGLFHTVFFVVSPSIGFSFDIFLKHPASFHFRYFTSLSKNFRVAFFIEKAERLPILRVLICFSGKNSTHTLRTAFLIPLSSIE